MVAMSGGVDSSVAAARLRDAGHDVTGVTMKLWGGAQDTGCCSVSDVDDARRVANQLGIEHHVFNFGDEFDRDVVGSYVRAHADGDTPNPCIECNRHIKFDSTRLPLTSGRVVDGDDGRVVGSVDALELVTIGQRKGLGTTGGTAEPRYVVDVDRATATVTVGSPRDLLADAVVLRDLAWASIPVD